MLEPGGSVIVKDHSLDSTRIKPPVGALFSLLMLLTTQAGRCYAFDEVEAWIVGSRSDAHQTDRLAGAAELVPDNCN